MEELKALGRTYSEFMREYSDKFKRISVRCPNRKRGENTIVIPHIAEWICTHKVNKDRMTGSDAFYCRHYNCPYLP